MGNKDPHPPYIGLKISHRIWTIHRNDTFGHRIRDNSRIRDRITCLFTTMTPFTLQHDQIGNFYFHNIDNFHFYNITSWIPGFARDPLSRFLSPSLSRPSPPFSYSSLPSTLPPSDYPASLRITAFPRYFLNLEA